jgi:very-short-patch-repair endonuclease
VTSPPRAILDSGRFIHDDYELEAIVAEAHYRGRACEPELRQQIKVREGRRGTTRLRAILDLAGGPQRTRSDGERAMLRLLRANKVLGFQANARVSDYEVDFHWAELNFCVELDGWDAHSSRAAFERDRLKWAELEASGIGVMPVTGRQLRDGDGTMTRLLAALRRRGYTG